ACWSTESMRVPSTSKIAAAVMPRQRRRRAAVPRRSDAAARGQGLRRVEPAEIAEELLEEAERLARRRRRALDHRDLLRVGQPALPDVADEAVLVELDRHDLLIDRRGREEGPLLGL